MTKKIINLTPFAASPELVDRGVQDYMHNLIPSRIEMGSRRIKETLDLIMSEIVLKTKCDSYLLGGPLWFSIPLRDKLQTFRLKTFAPEYARVDKNGQKKRTLISIIKL